MLLLFLFPLVVLKAISFLPDAEPGFETDGSLIEFPLDPGRLINELKILFDLDVEGIWLPLVPFSYKCSPSSHGWWQHN